MLRWEYWLPPTLAHTLHSHQSGRWYSRSCMHIIDRRVIVLMSHWRLVLYCMYFLLDLLTKSVHFWYQFLHYWIGQSSSNTLVIFPSWYLLHDNLVSPHIELMLGWWWITMEATQHQRWWWQRWHRAADQSWEPMPPLSLCLHPPLHPSTPPCRPPPSGSGMTALVSQIIFFCLLSSKREEMGHVVDDDDCAIILQLQTNLSHTTVGDREAGDGVYSGYFTQFTGNGRYSLSIIVSATNHTAALGGESMCLTVGFL